MPAVSDGAIVTYVGKWPSGNYAGFADYTGAVLADLSGAGLAVRGQSGGFGLSNSVLGTPFDIQLTIQVQNGLGFGNVNDIISIIRSFVYQEAGNFPIADSIPYIQNAGTGQVSTGQPGVTTPGSTGGSISDWFSSLTSKGLSTLGLVFIGLALGVVLLLTAQTKRSIGV